MRKIFLLLAILFSVFTIKGQNNTGYSITGNVTGFPNNTLISLTDIRGQITFDSAFVIDGKFELKGSLKDVPQTLRIQTTVENQFVYATLFIGNDEVKMAGDIKDFPYDVQISGPKTQSNWNNLINLTKRYFNENESLVKDFMEMSSDEKAKNNVSFNDNLKKIYKKIDSIEVSYIKSNLNTYVAALYLDLKKNSLPKETVEKLYFELSPKVRESHIVKPLELFLNVEIADIGKVSPNIEAIDKEGSLVHLSDLRGKYVLLDFTATGCAPCVASLGDLKELTENYNDSLVVVSYSQDTSKSVWLKTLNKHKSSWLNLWDGSGSNGKTSIEYGVNSIPAFFLINPDGVITEKWRGYSGVGSLPEKLKRFKNK